MFQQKKHEHLELQRFKKRVFTVTNDTFYDFCSIWNGLEHPASNAANVGFATNKSLCLPVACLVHWAAVKMLETTPTSAKTPTPATKNPGITFGHSGAVKVNIYFKR